MRLSVHRVPVPGMETHIPVLFLDLSGTLSFCRVYYSEITVPLTNKDAHFHPSADDFQSHLSPPPAGGLDTCLSEENEDEFFDLHIVKHHDSEVRRSNPGCR